MDLSKLSKQKKIGILIIIGTIMIGFLSYNIYNDFFASDNLPNTGLFKKDIEIPEADVAKVESSKMNAYKTETSAEKLWSSSEEDLYADKQESVYESGGYSSSPSSSGEGTTTVDIMADLTGNPSTESGSSSGRNTPQKSPKQNPKKSASSDTSVPKPGEPGYKEYKMAKHKQEMEQAATIAAQGQEPVIEPQESHEQAPEPSGESSIGTKVTVRKTSAMSTLDDGWDAGSGSGFSSLSDESEVISSDKDYPFECMFVRAEKLTDGSRVAVRLLEDMVVGGILIPRNTHLQAMCSIDNRLQLRIASIEMNSRIFSLGYEAYDSDGYKGIYCPDLKKEERQQIKSKGLSLFSSLIGARVGRAASDVVQTGVSIAENKNGQVTVSVPAGYKFFIVKSAEF